ncbi:MAG: TorF family putative porin, partial [Burkholderiaceae bacterium]
MKKTLLALSLAAAMLPLSAPVVKAEGISANVGLFSDYRFRGISQTDTKPALQGGFDYSHASGFYLGNWNSSLSSSLYPGSSGLESDLYFGYSTEVGGIGIDVGSNYYYYAGATGANTNELYVGLTYGPVTFKTSYATTDYFGATGSKNHLYYNLSGSVPLSEKVSLDIAAGYAAGKGGALKGY